MLAEQTSFKDIHEKPSQTTVQSCEVKLSEVVIFISHKITIKVGNYQYDKYGFQSQWHCSWENVNQDSVQIRHYNRQALGYIVTSGYQMTTTIEFPEKPTIIPGRIIPDSNFFSMSRGHTFPLPVNGESIKVDVSITRWSPSMHNREVIVVEELRQFLADLLTREELYIEGVKNTGVFNFYEWFIGGRNGNQY